MKVVIDTSSLLSLVRYYLPFDKDFVLYNFFKTIVESGEIVILNKVYEECKYTVKGIIIETITYLENKKIRVKTEDNKTDLTDKLISLILEEFSDDYKDLECEQNNLEIHNTLLALSVFRSYQKFDFTTFDKEKWSLEHIFPRNPDEIEDQLYQEDISLIKALRKSDWKEVGKNWLIDEMLLNENGAQQKIINIENKLNQNYCKLYMLEKELLYKLIKTSKLDSIGNMALLPNSVNSSLSNGMFDSKRKRISEKVSEGSFVPKHTYDVFSKLLTEKFNIDLTVYTEDDIKQHQSWILESIENIKKEIANV